MIKSKSHSCLGCNYHSHGSCMWFVVKKGYNRPKHIPHDTLLKGCKHRVSDKYYEGEYEEFVGKLIDLFEGEFV